MLILPVPPVELVEVEELDETTRGAGGFGHMRTLSERSTRDFCASNRRRA